MPSFAFNRPFAEQAEYFRKKLNLPTQAYDDITGAAHDHAFVVAGAMQADLLADLRAAVDKAIIEGKGLSAFRKDFKGIVEKSGWQHTGSANWRSRVIYTTNLRTSHAAGRWAQLTDPATTASRPYWRYVHSDYVLDPRPAHQAWDGLILPADDPWWSTHFPPNGWGCQCTIQAIAKDELATYGKDQPDDPPSDSNDTTGIDEGWDYAPGQSATEAARLAESKAINLAERDTAIARSYVATLMEEESFLVWQDRVLEEVAKIPRPDGLTKAAWIRYLQKTVPDQGSWPSAVLALETAKTIGSEKTAVLATTQTMIKQQINHPDLALTDYKQLQNIFDKPLLIVQQQRDALNTVFFKQSGKFYQATAKSTKTGKAILLLSFRGAKPGDMEKAIAEAGSKIIKDNR